MVDFNRELIRQRVPLLKRKLIAMAQQAVIDKVIADARRVMDQLENEEPDRGPEQ